MLLGSGTFGRQAESSTFKQNQKFSGRPNGHFQALSEKSRHFQAFCRAMTSHDLSWLHLIRFGFQNQEASCFQWNTIFGLSCDPPTSNGKSVGKRGSAAAAAVSIMWTCIQITASVSLLLFNKLPTRDTYSRTQGCAYCLGAPFWISHNFYRYRPHGENVLEPLARSISRNQSWKRWSLRPTARQGFCWEGMQGVESGHPS